MQNILNMNFLTIDASIKLSGEILGDNQYITGNNLVDLPDDYRLKLLSKVDWSNTNGTFFNSIFPSVEGHAKNTD